MKRIAIIGTIVALFALMVATVQAQDAEESPYTVSTVVNPNTGEVAAELIREETPAIVYEKHIEVLNACDWQGLMAQYPDQVEIHLPDGVVVSGRQDVGDLFAGFVLPAEEGGLCGLTFTEVSRFEVGGTLNVQWVADAPFLAEPYSGSDAYVSDDGLMVAMVTTFNGADLVFDETPAVVTNGDLVSDTYIREATPEVVYEKHIEVLNNCDWVGLMAQYPNDVEIHLPDGVVVKGREEVGDLFAGFVLPQEEGGLCGLTFTEESRQVVDGVVNVQWVATAPFLAEPYRGSDAYVTKDGLMVAQVTTFNGADLVFVE